MLCCVDSELSVSVTDNLRSLPHPVQSVKSRLVGMAVGFPRLVR